MAALSGIELRDAGVTGTQICTARDQLCHAFLESDCDKLVFVDADVSWEPGSLLKLASHPVDFVGGAYRFRSEPEAYPVSWIEGELWADPQTGLLEVKVVPAGFLALSRKALEGIRAQHPGRTYPRGGAEFHAFFWSPPGGTEEGPFCDDWRAAGGQVWLDPELTLTHDGYTGNIGRWLRNR